MTGVRELKQDGDGPRDPLVRAQCFLNGGISSLLSTVSALVVFPIYKTVFRQQIHSSSVRQAVAQLYKEGPTKLYRGFVPPLVMKTLNGALMFGLQDNLFQLLPLSSQNGTPIPIPARQALAGFGAGLAEAVFCTPFERVQSILQDSKNHKSLPNLRSVLSSLRGHGPHLGFYRGFLPISARNALGSSLYFGLKGPLSEVVAKQELPSIAISFISGTLTSMTISLFLYPFSVLASNMQTDMGKELKGAMASWRGLWKKQNQSIIQSISLLYRGGSLSILRSCITWGITTAIYERQEQRSG